MHTQRLTLSVLAALGLLTGCGTVAGDGSGDGGASVDTEQQVTGVHWNAQTVTVDGKEHRAPEGTYVKIDEDGKVQGSNGCNRFSTDASIDGATLDLGTMRTTLMACAKDRMTFEKTFGHAIAGKAEMKVDDDRLTLTSEKGDTVTFTAEPDAPLVGTAWTVTALNDRQTTTSLPKEAVGKARLTFTKDGHLRGSLGCNNVTATAKAADGKITFGTPTTTRKMCPAPVMKTEKALLAVLDGGTATYEVDHRALTVTGKDGSGFIASADRPTPQDEPDQPQGK